MPEEKADKPQAKKLAELAGPAATVLALVAHAGTRSDATGTRQDAVQAALRDGREDPRPAGGSAAPRRRSTSRRRATRWRR